jgi:hypothetical protein
MACGGVGDRVPFVTADAADAERDEAIGTRGVDFVAGLHDQPQRAERVTLDV